MADIAMTGQADANRTFRSIFGETAKPIHEEMLYLELEQRDSGAGVAVNDEDDDDEAMWNEAPLSDDTSEQDHKNGPGFDFTQRKSMEEWADDDDEEENWKEALQDRVNQLELVFQHNDDSAAAQSRRQLEQQQVQPFPAHDIQGTDFSPSRPVPRRYEALDIDPERPRQSSCHRMQRAASLHACITGDDAVVSDCQSRHWNCERKVAGDTALNPNRRMRSTSIDFVDRSIQIAEHYRTSSGSLSRTESPRHSLSRKTLFDNIQSSLCSSSLRSTNADPPADTTYSFSPSAAVLNLSDTEAIRRFMLEDAKNMSMERLVSDAQRLHFLEDFYQNRQGLCLTPSVTTSTAVSPPPYSPSSSTMSTS